MRIPADLKAHGMRGKTAIFYALFVASLLAGCGEEPPATTEAVTRPVKTITIGGADVSGARSFPARVAAAARADLAFRVSGTVQEIPIKEGDRLKEGDLVARLDPTDFQIVVDDRQATFDKAEKNFGRGQELITSGAISQADFDRLEADFKNARAALNAAMQDLAYTELKAPFDGVIATREVDQFEEVRAKQAIAVLQNIQMLEIKCDIPESIVRSLQSGADEQGRMARDKVKAFASFQGRPGEVYPLVFKEISTKADAKTQTFEVTYLMKQWEKGTVLPGMTATVSLDLSDYSDGGLVFTLPVTAVVGDYKLDPQVWSVDEASMTVSPRSVKVGRLIGNGIQVLEGLEAGAQVVTAGAPFLVEGQRVTVLPELEQAEPRPEDLKYQQ